MEKYDLEKNKLSKNYIPDDIYFGYAVEETDAYLRIKVIDSKKDGLWVK